MAERSIHLETLLKLQSALEMFDMSFSTSNKLFRLALVSEMIDTAGLFEQLAEDWKDNLPYGEGPDLDVDFEYWSEYKAWENLHMRATQNECIEGFPISLGNGRTSENAKRFKKSTYTKYLSSIFKSTRYEGKDTATDFLKFLMDDKTGTTRFGNIVSYALFHLTSAIRKANAVLQSPSDASLSRYYDAQLMRSESYIKEELHKVRDILNDTTISEKRKENSLRALKDSISESLRESGFLKEFKSAFNHYDIDDYRKENPEQHELSDDQVLEKLALSDLFDSNGEPHKIKIARHIFNHRKVLSSEAIASFFVYVKVLPEIDQHLSQYVAQHNLKETKSISLRTISNNLTGIDAGIMAVHQAHLCNAADWAVVSRIMEEKGTWQRNAFTAHAEYINSICRENVTSSTSLSRSPIYTKVAGEYPNWTIRPSEQTRETASKLQTYLQIAELFISSL